MEPKQPDNDHDLLLDLRGEMRGLRKDVDEIKLNTNKVVDDHETRVRKLEQFMDNMKGKYAILALFGSIFASIVTSWFVRHI